MRWGPAILAVLLLLSAPAAADDAEPRLGEFIPATPPLSAPAISFADGEGHTHSLADFAGKPVLINLWATWCHPCIEEMPSLVKLQQRLDGRLTLLAISEDHGGAGKVTAFLADHHLDAISPYLDPKSEVGQALDVEGLPTSVLVSRDGRIVGRVQGAADWNSAKIAAAIAPFLSGDDSGVVKTSARPGPP